MIYGDLKTQFAGLLNRRDLTPSLTTTFIGMGIQRIQRELRVAAMEKESYATTDGTPNIPIPGDLLELIALTYTTSYTSNKLVRVDTQSGLRASQEVGDPQWFTRRIANFVLGPCPASGTQIFVQYYADASNLAADTDHNWLTDATPDLLIYAALTYAADYFLDDRLQRFENRYLQIADALTTMSQADELENASILPQWTCD